MKNTVWTFFNADIIGRWNEEFYWSVSPSKLGAFINNHVSLNSAVWMRQMAPPVFIQFKYRYFPVLLPEKGIGSNWIQLLDPGVPSQNMLDPAFLKEKK